MQTETTPLTRRARLGRHLRNNLVGYVALVIAVSMTPIPSYAAQLAIGTSGIKNGAVTTPKLANGAVKAHKLGANAVKSAKITDGSVQKVDIAAAARGYTTIKTERAGVAVAASTNSAQTVACPSGGVAIGGGAYVASTALFPLPGSTPGELVISVPMNAGSPFSFTAGDNESPNAWKTIVTNTQGDPTTAYHYAICAWK